MASGQFWQIGKSLKDVNQHMLDTGLGSDITFCVGKEGVEQLAHMYILVSRSPVFEAMFLGPVAEVCRKIKIPDVSHAAFKVLLQYMYTEEVNLDRVDIALEVLYAAKKYIMNSLEELCRSHITKHLAATNVCTVLGQTSGLDENGLTEVCHKFIAENTYTVVQSEDWKQLCKESMLEIMQSDNLIINEGTLFEALVRWASYQSGMSGEPCTTTPGTTSAIADHLVPFKDLIRFPLVPYSKLVNTPHGLLSQDDLNEIYNFQNGFRPQSTTAIKCRGSRLVRRFQINPEFKFQELMMKPEAVKRTFRLEYRALHTGIEILGMYLMGGPYLVRATIHDDSGFLMCSLQRDFRSCPREDCCKELPLMFEYPIPCNVADNEHWWAIDVYLTESDVMVWYDHVIQNKFVGNADVKLKMSNPEIISKLCYMCTDKSTL